MYIQVPVVEYTQPQTTHSTQPIQTGPVRLELAAELYSKLA